jgi:hypothetical protein
MPTPKPKSTKHARAMKEYAIKSKREDAEFNRRDVFSGNARTQQTIDTDNTMGVATVTLRVLSYRNNREAAVSNPDQRVFVEVKSRFGATTDGLYQYPALMVRASELDDIISGLQTAVAEGRRAGIIAPKEGRTRTWRRLTRKRRGS